MVFPSSSYRSVNMIDVSMYLRFDVFTAVTMKDGVFWDVAPRGSCKNRCFGGTLYFCVACVGC
jgi:hypothetical protein